MMTPLPRPKLKIFVFRAFVDQDAGSDTSQTPMYGGGAGG
jgi:hypothetical protein